MTTRDERIRSLLTEAFAPTLLEVENDSAQHAGHAGHRHDVKGPGAGSEGETHYTVRVVSPAFAGLSRVERHRRVNDALAAEIATGLHALAIVAKAPGE